MNLSESLIAEALAPATPTPAIEPIPMLGDERAQRSLEPEVSVEVVEPEDLGPVPADPEAAAELAESIARSKVLEFTRDELSQLRLLTGKALVDVLTEGSDKDRIAASKLVVLMARVEKETYLELRKQNLEASRSRRGTVLRFPNGAYLAQIAEDAGGRK